MTRAGSVRKPRLIIVVTEDWAFLTHRLELALAAKAAGFDVAVAAHVGKDGQRIRDAGLGLHPIPLDRGGLGPTQELRTLARLVGLYRSERPDIVHHVALKPVLYGAIAAKAARVPAVVNALGGLGYVFRSDEAKARLMRSAITPALRFALAGKRSRLILQNRDDKRVVLELGLAREERLRLVRGAGVDLRRYRFVEHDTPQPLVILPARILHDKGVVEFVTAARSLRAKGLKARFAIVGQRDPANPACIAQDEVEAWRREGIVELWGWRSDMPSVFAEAQVVCLPSYHEGLPKVLLEAAASRAAIVASDIPGCREVVEPDKTGWIVPARDAGALEAAIEEAILRPDLRLQRGTAARSLTERELSSDRIIGETIGIYRELLG